MMDNDYDVQQSSVIDDYDNVTNASMVYNNVNIQHYD